MLPECLPFAFSARNFLHKQKKRIFALRKNNTLRVLSTKILPSAQQKILQKHGITLFEQDFIRTEKVVFSVVPEADALIFTSQNAVRSVADSAFFEGLKSKPVFCVGSQTEKLLKNYSWETIFPQENATDLAQFLVNQPKRRYVFFCGNLRREAIPSALQKAKIPFAEILAYRTKLQPQKTQVLPQVILFFSPSAVKSFALKNTPENSKVICIGSTTAQEAQKYFAEVFISQKATIQSVIEKCLELKIKFYDKK